MSSQLNTARYPNCTVLIPENNPEFAEWLTSQDRKTHGTRLDKGQQFYAVDIGLGLEVMRQELSQGLESGYLSQKWQGLAILSVAPANPTRKQKLATLAEKLHHKIGTSLGSIARVSITLGMLSVDPIFKWGKKNLSSLLWQKSGAVYH